MWIKRPTSSSIHILKALRVMNAPNITELESLLPVKQQKQIKVHNFNTNSQRCCSLLLQILSTCRCFWISRCLWWKKIHMTADDLSISAPQGLFSPLFNFRIIFLPKTQRPHVRKRAETYKFRQESSHHSSCFGPTHRFRQAKILSLVVGSLCKQGQRMGGM